MGYGGLSAPYSVLLANILGHTSLVHKLFLDLSSPFTTYRISRMLFFKSIAFGTFPYIKIFINALCLEIDS